MKKKIFLLIILMYVALLRFWQIGKIPPLINNSSFEPRVFSAVLSVLTALVLFFYIKKLYKSSKLGLLSAWIFSIIPWSIEQGRIYSQVNFALFFFLLILLTANKVKSRLRKFFLYLLIPVSFYFIYPQFWLYKARYFSLDLSSAFVNILFLLSPEFVFFKNPTFWWGGVRNFGIIYLSFLPFFAVGVYKLVINLKSEIIVWFILILLLAASSSFFPESREFFLNLPFVCLTVALGMKSLFSQKGKSVKIILIILLFLITYDIASFLHYYTVHYPQQVEANKEKIREGF